MKIVYWISTSIICMFLLTSSYTYLFHKTTIEGFKKLGFPMFFITQLAILKIIAVFIVLLPNLPSYLKEWSYAGVMLFFITALNAHVAHKDSISISIMLIVLMFVLALSYYTMSK